MDAVTGPLQETISATHNPTVMTVTFWINIFPTLAMYAYTSFSGEFYQGLEFCRTHPAIVVDIVLYCILSAVGQSLIVWSLFRFNSMTVTVITTTRKFFSILASVLFYRNPLTSHQWFGVLLVFSGIIANSRYKYLERREKQVAVNAT
uniref:Solute carrier family 35 member B1 n=1 Tax=Lygus hesperus TaxID=30085 RepID=A0A0A9YLR9_LYGHE